MKKTFLTIATVFTLSISVFCGFSFASEIQNAKYLETVNGIKINTVGTPTKDVIKEFEYSARTTPKKLKNYIEEITIYSNKEYDKEHKDGGLFYADGYTWGTKEIVINGGSPSADVSTYLHEVAHNYDFINNNISSEKEFYNIFLFYLKYKDMGNTVYGNYCQTDCCEFFAETCSIWYLDRDGLKKELPLVYNWFKKNFNDKEVEFDYYEDRVFTTKYKKNKYLVECGEAEFILDRKAKNIVIENTIVKKGHRYYVSFINTNSILKKKKYVKSIYLKCSKADKIDVVKIIKKMPKKVKIKSNVKWIKKLIKKYR